MYRKTNPDVQEFENFYLPFGGKLNLDNRWLKQAKLVPWEMAEQKYAGLFVNDKKMGKPAKPVRMALGSLLIQQKCGFTDEETVEQIRENPYMQAFIGLREYSDKRPFDSSMLVHFRKRITPEMLNEINEEIAGANKKKDKDDGDQSGGSASENKGKLILDATCAPADIKYPTDLNLLNEAREKLETVIDDLYETVRDKLPKPRTYRKKARQKYLHYAKSKKLRMKSIRKAIGQQLRFVKRDLASVELLLKKGASLTILNKQQYKKLLVIQELYRQQKEMYDSQVHRVDSRIVSISQPHVRPIVRGKAGADTEFGAKISISVLNGFSFLDILSWESYNEGLYLEEQVERFYRRFGCYPEVVIADKIYRNRDNFKTCKDKGIRLSGPPLGRPKMLSQEEKKKQRLQEREDEGIRNSVEGSFGVGKRRYGLGQVMTKLKITSETVISLNFVVMNLAKRLRLLLRQIFRAVWTAGVGEPTDLATAA